MHFCHLLTRPAHQLGGFSFWGGWCWFLCKRLHALCAELACRPCGLCGVRFFFGSCFDLSSKLTAKGVGYLIQVYQVEQWPSCGVQQVAAVSDSEHVSGFSCGPQELAQAFGIREVVRIGRANASSIFQFRYEPERIAILAI